MKIAQSNTREQFPLSTRKILKKTIANSLIWAILLFIVFVVTSLAGMEILSVITLALMFIMIFLIYLYQSWYFAVYFYDLTQDYIVIKKGPITPQEITIPYERVQDVYVDQDLLDRILRIYDVHLSSATVSSGMEAHIDGVEKPAADGLRAILLQTVSERISKRKAPAPPPASVPTSSQSPAQPQV
ncbi:MAG TPA: PH domain-containing protein [Candidatus Kaiserbacteria bacterium]|nr:PH domain-containing protein [Candidatus Kaiserbacteria bacterium]